MEFSEFQVDSVAFQDVLKYDDKSWKYLSQNFIDKVAWRHLRCT